MTYFDWLPDEVLCYLLSFTEFSTNIVLVCKRFNLLSYTVWRLELGHYTAGITRIYFQRALISGLAAVKSIQRRTKKNDFQTLCEEAVLCIESVYQRWNSNDPSSLFKYVFGSLTFVQKWNCLQRFMQRIVYAIDRMLLVLRDIRLNQEQQIALVAVVDKIYNESKFSLFDYVEFANTFMDRTTFSPLVKYELAKNIDQHLEDELKRLKQFIKVQHDYVGKLFERGSYYNLLHLILRHKQQLYAAKLELERTNGLQ